MTPDSVGPLSRPLSVARLPSRGMEAEVAATEPERDALARDLDLVALRSLTGRYRVTEVHGGVRVTGRVRAEVVRTCVVTLDAFASELSEEVDVEFRRPTAGEDGAAGGEHEADLDAPDQLVDDRIDLGAITAEFFALGLDPYPRKPGASLPIDQEGSGSSPFSALGKLLRDDEG